ncbi:MAG: hypothetical protein K0R65_2746 [Crocinitomicaceae bacterium]|jgi:hypothetical protein|nr:hypothetical protein [Crocinitomicaceae bacterium]
MKKKLFTALAVLLCQQAISQSTSLFLRDTLSQNRLSLSVSLSDSLEDLDTVRIVLLEETESDTLVLSESLYSVSENDAKDFYSLTRGEDNYIFGLGLFNAGTYRCKLYLKREGEAEEEINLN